MQHVLLISEEAAQALFDGMIPVVFPQALGFRGLVGLHSLNGTPMTASINITTHAKGRKNQTIATPKQSRMKGGNKLKLNNSPSAKIGRQAMTTSSVRAR